MHLIPKSTAPFFQEYRFESLDTAAHAALIMERLLACGNRSEIRWLFENYGADKIRTWLERDGERLLPRRRYELWRVLFDLPGHQIAERRQAWPY
jgi:Family of unknown function (DUF6922)